MLVHPMLDLYGVKTPKPCAQNLARGFEIMGSRKKRESTPCYWVYPGGPMKYSLTQGYDKSMALLVFHSRRQMFSKQTTHVVSSHSETPLGVGTSHGHFGPQDTPRPRLGGSHHLPPYSILCAFPPRLHPSGSFSRDSQVGVPKLSRNCPGWGLGTLGVHNSRLQSPIVTRSKPKL
jgi:hypothetical protein